MSVLTLLKNQVQHPPLWGGGCEDNRRAGGQRRNQETLFPLPTLPGPTRTNAGDSLTEPLSYSRTIQVPTEYVTRFKDLKVSQERMLVLGMIAAMDEAVGKVVDALKRSGDFNNTLIIFTTDNGGSVSHASSNLPLRGTKVMQIYQRKSNLIPTASQME